MGRIVEIVMFFGGGLIFLLFSIFILVCKDQIEKMGSLNGALVLDIFVLIIPLWGAQLIRQRNSRPPDRNILDD